MRGRMHSETARRRGLGTRYVGVISWARRGMWGSKRDGGAVSSAYEYVEIE